MSASALNFLLIQCDQLNPAFLRQYGNPIADTPNLDKLADRSFIFDSAYTNFPLCAPSRFSMLSGQLASKIGAYDNGAEFVSATPTIAHYMRTSGYQTSLVGKMHFVGADQLHGYEERVTTDIYPADFNWTGDWTEAVMGQSNNAKTFTDAGICLRNVQMEYDEEVCHRGVRKIFDLARRNDPRPFFLTISMTHPHDPYQCLQPHWDRYDHDAIDMPVVANLTEAQSDPYSKRLLIQYGLDSFTPSEEQIRVARHAYYGSISYLDDQVGKILNTLEVTGLDQNTVIVFTSDHGDMLGERGMWYKKCFFESSVRVPLMIHAPGSDSQRISENVSLVDLLPTFVEMATDKPPGELILGECQGNSLRGLIQGQDTDWPDTVYSENLAEGAGAAIVMVKQGKIKYTRSGIDPEQLFDLEADPQELNNLAGDAGYSDIQKSLGDKADQMWDVDKLSEQVRASQQQRMFVREALKIGAVTPWDYAAPDQTINHSLRGTKKYNDWAYNAPIGLKRPK